MSDSWEPPMRTNSIEQKIAPPGEKKQVRGGTRLSKNGLEDSDAHFGEQVPRCADHFPDRSRGGIVGGGGVVAGGPIWISAGAAGSAEPMAASCWARAAASRSTGMPPATITGAL